MPFSAKWMGLEMVVPSEVNQTEKDKYLMISFTGEIKRRILLGRKVMTNLDSILKSRDITLSTKVRLVKATVFPVVMWKSELDYKES